MFLRMKYMLSVFWVIAHLQFLRFWPLKEPVRHFESITVILFGSAVGFACLYTIVCTSGMVLLVYTTHIPD